MPGDKLQAQKVKTGRPPSGLAPIKKDLLRLYVRGGKSIREVAEALGVSKDMVARALKGHGIEARTNARWSKLKEYDLNYLEDGVRQKGLRAFARELKVGNSTLLQHIRARK